MSRIRVSTTVDESLLENARRLRSKLTDSALLDEALEALLARHRAGRDRCQLLGLRRAPTRQPDDWGDLHLFARPQRLMTPLPARGELWWCELADIGRRPVVVLSRDAAIPRLGRALIAPCTTTIRHIPSEVVLEPGDDPVPLRSRRQSGLGRERLGRGPRRAPWAAQRRTDAPDLRRARSRCRLSPLTQDAGTGTPAVL